MTLSLESARCFEVDISLVATEDANESSQVSTIHTSTRPHVSRCVWTQKGIRKVVSPTTIPLFHLNSLLLHGRAEGGEVVVNVDVEDFFTMFSLRFDGAIIAISPPFAFNLHQYYRSRARSERCVGRASCLSHRICKKVA